MKEVLGNLWEYPATWRVVPTNGEVNRQGLAIMGRGVALEAADRYPRLRRDLGNMLKMWGNRVHVFPNHMLVTFPTKHRWRDQADLRLIAHSAGELAAEAANRLSVGTIALPRVGCGFGELNWFDVSIVLHDLLVSARFVLITRLEDLQPAELARRLLREKL